MQHKHLNIFEREVILEMSVEGKSISAIADTLRRNKGTVSRELMRNSEEEFYSPYLAQVKATSRRRHSKEPWKMKETRICEYVKRGLREYWSPEQIAGRIKIDYPDDPAIRISHECIYAWIYTDKKSGGKWYQRLRQSHRKRRKRYGSSEKRGHIVNRKGIEERPGIVDRRERIGDWEGDTIEGAKGSGYIATCVERKSRMTLLAKLPDKRAKSLNRGTMRVFEKHSDIPRLTLTVDNGKEFARHEDLGRMLA